MSKEFNLVVLGASGVTGKYVIRELAKAAKENEKLTWAVAGRDDKKLKEALLECGCEGNNISRIVVDIKDESSINDMCKRANVILNTVGPFYLYGEVVIKACIQNGTHHLDVSGEPLFLEAMQLKYHEAAKEAGVYIVGACGFDSIPADMGVEYLKQHFEGDLNSVETYLTITSGPKGYNVGLGTWNSLIHGLSNAGKLKEMRKELCNTLYPSGTPKSNFKLKTRGVLFNSDVANGWCMIFPGSDRSIVIRSQMANYELYNSKPVYVQTYIRFGHLIFALLTALMAGIFGVFTASGCGRYLLKTYPGFFSLGLFRKEGPTEEQVRDTKLKMTLVGEGWANQLGLNEEHIEAPNKKLTLNINGPDGGYLVTSMALVAAGVTVYQENEQMPSSGGVYTTATAFTKTSLIDKLQKGGLKFEIED